MKFDGTWSQFRGFHNEVCLVIQMHHSQYPIDASWVALVGMLLSGTTFVWFSPLLENRSLFLINLRSLFSKFKACFRDCVKEIIGPQLMLRISFYLQMISHGTTKHWWSSFVMTYVMMSKTYFWLSLKNRSRSWRQSVEQCNATIGISNNIQNDSYKYEGQDRNPHMNQS